MNTECHFLYLQTGHNSEIIVGRLKWSSLALITKPVCTTASVLMLVARLHVVLLATLLICLPLMRRDCQTFAFIKSDMVCTGRIASPTDSPRGQHQHPGSGGDSEQDAEAAYHRMELLSQSISIELQRDLHIHDSAVLPNFVNLPQVSFSCAR